MSKKDYTAVLDRLHAMGVEPTELTERSNGSFIFRKAKSQATMTAAEYAWRILSSMRGGQINNQGEWVFEGREYINIHFIPDLDSPAPIPEPMKCGEATGRKNKDGSFCHCELVNGKCAVHDRQPKHKVGQMVWAVVTADGVPTQARVLTPSLSVVEIQSTKTGSTFKVPVKQVSDRPILNIGDVIFAIVTDDGVPTKGTVEQINDRSVVLKSLRTGNAYDVPDASVHYTAANAKFYHKH
ncbi:MAG: hypothetical protein FOGNACKC_00833 [Anaerolineae bacterium]|nr:hypothetical protein [Anaerolineae bacterium]